MSQISAREVIHAAADPEPAQRRFDFLALAGLALAGLALPERAAGLLTAGLLTAGFAGAPPGPPTSSFSIRSRSEAVSARS